MSTARLVPETWHLTGDDAMATLRHTGRRVLLRDAFMRMRASDGFSHARSLAFLTALMAVQGVVALVGLATAFGGTGFADAVNAAVRTVVPGQAGAALTGAAQQARQAATTHDYIAVALGSLGTLVTATTAMGQVERALNRLYGVEKDRPTIRKYGRAFGLTLTAGSMLSLGFASVAFGRSAGKAIGSDAISTAWNVLHWPLGLACMAAAMALLFKYAPRRRQPAWSWLAFGSTVSIVLWFGVTVALNATLRASTTFGDTYGPLAGLVALLLWSLFSSVAVVFGAAVAAQLEAVRRAAPGPQDHAKAANSEPAAGADELVRR